MTRAVSLTALLTLAAALGAVTPDRAGGVAAPQPVYKTKRFKVRWLERGHLAEGHIEFRVTLIEATARGWVVRARMTNRSPFTLRIPSRIADIPVGPAVVRFRSRDTKRPYDLGTRTTLYRATRLHPAIPPELAPGESWSGTFGGRKRLPRRTPLSLSFGQFNYFTDGYLHRFSWITDHVFRI